jgi:hypothetical protein
MMIPMILAVQLAAGEPAKDVLIDPLRFAEADPTKAAAYFSPEALNSPVGTCRDQPKAPAVSSVEASWYSGIWIRAREPSLAATANSSPRMTWRFTDIPNLSAPMVFRISLEGNGRLHMIAKRLSGKGGYDPGSLRDQVDRMLTSDEQRRFQKALLSVEDVLAKPIDHCSIVLDSDQLILERTQAGRYVIGQRYSQTGKTMTEMNELLVHFAGWRR